MAYMECRNAQFQWRSHASNVEVLVNALGMGYSPSLVGLVVLHVFFLMARGGPCRRYSLDAQRAMDGQNRESAWKKLHVEAKHHHRKVCCAFAGVTSC